MTDVMTKLNGWKQVIGFLVALGGLIWVINGYYYLQIRTDIALLNASVNSHMEQQKKDEAAITMEKEKIQKEQNILGERTGKLETGMAVVKSKLKITE